MPRTTLASLAALSSLAVAALAPLPLFAADDAAAAKPVYQKERADCDTGRTTNQDRATCLKEAGAAQVERKRNTLDNAGSARQNAIDRCKTLPAKDQTDCLARIEGPKQPGQTTTSSGSVAGGGVIKETRTVTVGEPVVIIPASPAPAASR